MRKAVRGRSIAVAVAVAVGLVVEARADSFSVSFGWCSKGTPEFSLNGVPLGTARLAFRMTDLQAPWYKHGGGEIAYSGQSKIPCGQLKGTYDPPAPPSGPHTYRWTIKAIDAKGKVLAQTTTQRQFPE